MPILGNVGAGTDADAIHDNEAGEINAIAEKATPVAADLLVIEDSADSNNKKKVQVGNLPGGAGTDADAIHDNVAGEIDAITAKATPVGADQMLIEDSADSNNKKKITISSLDLPGQDSTALHDNVAGEIAALTDKASPVGADMVVIEDSADANNKKRVSISNLPGGTDADAIHDNVAGEIDAVAEKVAPVGADIILIEDSADSNNKKKVQITNLPGGADADAIHDNVAGEIIAVTEKATPVSADVLLIEDSADSNNKKRVQIGNLPGGTDADAIHDNVAGEIDAITAKGTPVGADQLLIEDSADSNNKKKIAISSLDLPGQDSTAIHDNVAGEINAVTEKATPVAADLILVEDSADSNNKKKVQVGNLPGTGAGGDTDAIHDNVAGEITAVTEKVTPVSADVILIEDSADSNNKKRVQIGNLPGGGSPLEIEDESVSVDAAVTKINFLGTGVTATQAAAGEVDVTVPGVAIPDSFENENIRYSGFTSRNGSDYILLKTEEFNDSSGNMVSYSEPGGDHSRFTFDSPCLFSAQMACQGSLNPKELLWFNSADTLLMSSYDEIDNNKANAGLVGRASTGDYLVYRSTDNPTDDDQCNFAVIAMDERKPGASKWESYSTTGFTSANGAGQILFKTVKEDSTGTISTVTTGDHTRFTFNEDTDFWASTSVRSSSGQGLVQIALFNSSNTQIITTVDVATTGEGGVACLAARASAGDYLIAAKQAAITASDSLDTNFNIMVADIDPVSGYESDAISRSGFTSKNGSGFVRLSTAHQDSGGPLVTFSEPGSDHTRYTFDKACSFTSNFGVSAASSGVVEVRQYNSSNVLIQRGTDRSHSSTSGSACLVSKASVGDYIVAYMDSATSDNNSNTSFSVVATEVTPALVGGGGSALEIEDEAVSVDTAVTKINFTGAGVTATQTAAGEVDVTVPGGGGSSEEVTYVKDIQPNGTTAGAISSGISTRRLNTLEGDNVSMGITLSSNQVTFANDGDYELSAFASAHSAGTYDLRFFNVSDSTTELFGVPSYAGGSNQDCASTGLVAGRLTVSGAPKTYELRQYSGDGEPLSTGQGFRKVLGEDEVFATIEIRKK